MILMLNIITFVRDVLYRLRKAAVLVFFIREVTEKQTAVD